MDWNETKQQARLARWLDGEMTPAELDELRSDARADADLAAEMVRYEKLEALLGQFGKEPTNIDEARQLEAIMQAVRSRRRLRFWRPVLGVAAAAAAVLVVASVFLAPQSPAPSGATGGSDVVAESPASPIDLDAGRVHVAVVARPDHAAGRIAAEPVRLDSRSVPARARSGGGTVVVTTGPELPAPSGRWAADSMTDFFGG